MSEASFRTIIPAHPGFDVVELGYAPDWKKFFYTPVVAWLVTVPDDAFDYPFVLAITADPECNDPDKSEIIRQPDGSIMFAYGPTFSKGQENEALAHAVEEKNKKLKAAARA